MGIEFHVGRTDHHSVEDYLGRDHDGVTAINLEAKYASHQEAVAEVAHSEGIAVFLDPRTDRLEHPGLHLQQLPGYREEGYRVAELAASDSTRQRLAESVVDAQVGLVSSITPAYFFGQDERSMNLNLDLADITRTMTDLPVRPIVTMKSRVSAQTLAQVAEDYARLGFDQVDLRFSPLGGEHDSITKIRSVFAATQMFTSAGVAVTLGHAGNIGQVAYALGYISSFSSGIGMGEKVNLASDYQRQNQPPRRGADGRTLGGGQWEGVYLPGLAMTLKKSRAAALLEHSDIRTRIGRCRVGACSNSVTGPTSDHRSHYLHSKAGEVAFLQNTPAPWRAEAEIKRLRRAHELREIVNSDYKKRGEPLLQTRTLKSLLDEIGIARNEAVA
ncbi:hypothetical protein FHX49_000637 [Microbacterium endophyticum]|uniref:Uncharacterized protein n=1 Tax=Microbacterium endophyticum TaxID=1526412 RepID=A0A7W4V1H1_9MICO|nr:hypothetical protein [Microbacterium endophyticum]MBB2975096.1 hypothetical protein [Microbacterium endophyticum]NIK37364.1 hypothetical protein [Microbacterium endophyticum]